jgi:sugar lactone lactonase YvrE
MKTTMRPYFKAAATALLMSVGPTSLHADEYQVNVVARGLNKPTGIAIRANDELYFTEVPTPGVAGQQNGVKQLDLDSGEIRTIHVGEPDPTNIAIDRAGNLYWTCRSAGVILEQDPEEDQSTATVVARNLQRPTGIALNRRGDIYFTEVPTPALAGPSGGKNTVSVIPRGSTEIKVLDAGDPEPTDIVSGVFGEQYWTCKSAGVIVRRAFDGKTTPILQGLNKPVGIALSRSGRFLYWTEVPTPGVAGSAGGQNKIWEYDLFLRVKKLVHSGDPEPTDITVSRRGDLYWTCTSAGVILEAKRGRPLPYRY